MNELPHGWVTTTIGAIAELENGRAFKPSDWAKAGVPIVRIQNLNRPEAPFNLFSGNVGERHVVRDGDLLFAWSGTPGTSFGAHIWRGPTAVLNQHIFNVRVDSRFIDREFLRIAINQTLAEQIAKAHGGAGLRHVTKRAFEETEIILPPLAEQKRIIDRLTALEGRGADILARFASVATLIESARAAVLQAAYDLSLLTARRNSPIPLISLGEVATDLTYGSSSKSLSSGEIPVLRMGNIQQGEIDWSDLVYTSDPMEIERYLLHPGDVLFNRTNSPSLVGKTAIYRGQRPAIFAGYLIRVRCSERVVPEYLAHCLNSPAGRSYCRAVKSDGVSQSNINSKKLAAFKFRCPSVSDQREIVAKVKVAFSRLSVIAERTQTTHNLLSTMKQQFVDRALTGRLGTSDQSDEDAVIQVERLKAAKAEVKEKVRVEAIVGAKTMSRGVREILRGAKSWLSAQDIAQQYGITFGTDTEMIEPFYAELRELDGSGDLLTEAILDEMGRRVGERLKLKDPA